MNTKITILIAVGLIFAATATQAQNPYRNDHRDLRYDRMDVRHDRYDLGRDRREGNFYAARHDRRDLRFDRHDLRHDRRYY